MTNSDDSPRSKAGFPLTLLVAAALGLLITAAIWFCLAHGYILYYGDAQAHLDISRSLIDAIAPGYDQIGTVWLPLLHLICLPFVWRMDLWSTGLAGAIPVAICFVIAGTCCFSVATWLFEDRLAALVAVACLASNPNILYLGSIPMTEVVFLAALFLFLLAFSRRWLMVAILASWGMSLTRYDGWFLIPFEALWFALRSLRQNRRRVFCTFAALASLVPLYWAGHCWWETGNALDFINGPYSAKAIQGGKPYPGLHDWAVALTYYGSAGRDCAGWPLLLLSVVGIACALSREKYSVLLFLLLTPAFYIWSLHSSGTPIFVPELWPYGLYNTRYGVAVVALAATAAGGIVLILPQVLRKWSFVIPLIALLPWLVHPSMNNVICWRESEVNSRARRVWTAAAANFLAMNYHPDERVLAPFGDLTGIFCRARIPLRQVIHEGSGPLWETVMQRPDLLHPAAWAIAQSKSHTDKVLLQAPTYTLYKSIDAPGSPPLDIFERKYVENPVH